MITLFAPAGIGEVGPDTDLTAVIVDSHTVRLTDSAEPGDQSR